MLLLHRMRLIILRARLWMIDHMRRWLMHLIVKLLRWRMTGSGCELSSGGGCHSRLLLLLQRHLIRMMLRLERLLLLCARHVRMMLLSMLLLMLLLLHMWWNVVSRHVVAAGLLLWRHAARGRHVARVDVR